MMTEEETSERVVYRCYYCNYEGEGEDCFWHTQRTHSNQVLKLRKRELNSQSGKLGFRTLNYQLIPDILKKTNKTIHPEFSNGQISVRVFDVEAYNDFGIFNLSLDEISPDSPLAKNMRTSTPHKVASVVFNDNATTEDIPFTDDDIYFARKYDDDDEIVIGCTDNSMMDENERLMTEIQTCLPDVVRSLRECGQLENWIQFHHLIKEGTFPLDNIAFHLFIDVCRFYSQKSTSTMRYNPVVKRFWRIGYCLFHGKFLNFMSGPKHIGDKMYNPNESLNPKNAQINFAVPFKSIRKSKSDENFAPGILYDIVDKIADQANEMKTYKLCVDGKKINAGRSNKSGDIDLFGFEQSPTLRERKERLDGELFTIQTLNDKFVDLEIRGRTNPYQFPANDKAEVRSLLQEAILHVSNRIADLRKTKVNKNAVLEKLKKNGGADWRKSKFMYVISSLQTDLYDISVIIDDLLKSVSELGLSVAVINGTSHLYTDEKTVNLEFQENFVHLSDGTSIDNCDTDPRHIKQGSEEWHKVRSSAKVTGSTLHKAVGLSSLKQQQNHFDTVIFNKERETHTIETQERMKYGTENEINAITTLVSKILPVYEPALSYFEEGCCKYSTRAQQVPVVVSPDGSLRKTVDDEASFGVECKCPFPGKTYTTPVYYKLPKYYVTQVLSEMVALNTKELYFICYSEESSTVFKITYSDDLWKSIEQEVEVIYGGETAVRPSRKSTEIKIIQDKIEKFSSENVSFLAEVPSVKAVKCKSSTDEIYCLHTRQPGSKQKVCNIKEVMECVRRCETTINRAYQLSRTKASEFLGFMISDTDRQNNPESCYAIPIAYGLKGYSLPTKTLREMIECVIQFCSEKGLYTPVCSFDGQWFKMAVRDRDDQPLTMLQLQKDVYTFVKKMSKGEIVKNICEVNIVKCQGRELQESVQLERNGTCLTVGNGNKAYRLVTTYNVAKMIKSKEHPKTDNTINLEENENTEIIKEMIGSLHTVSNNNIDEQVVADAIDVARSVDHDLDVNDNSNNPDEHMIENLDEILKDTDFESVDNSVDPETIQPNRQVQNVKNDVTESEFLSSLSSVENTRAMLKMFNEKHPEMCLDEMILKEKLKDASSVNKYFTKNQLVVLLSPLLPFLKANKVKCNVSQPKYVFVNLLSNIFGDGSNIQSRVRIKKNPSSLVSLCKKAVQKLPKIVLNSMYAQHIYPEKLEQWQNGTPFGHKMCINGISEINPCCWYSKPEFNNVLQNFLFVILDAYHQVCGLRRLFCASGIPASGVSKTPIHKVAENIDSNDSELSVAIVIDMIDKQSIAYAVQTFSENVQRCLLEMDAYNEAEFCELVRNWYRAEDEPGMAALERCDHRLKFRQWLLKDVRFNVFPPHGSYVKDIPIVLFEGLILGIERKLQLYPFTRAGTYNTRAIGSLDIENFFSTFQDLDPRGTGVLRSDDIQTAVGIAMELLDARLDPERGFYMQTSRKRVYPTNELENEYERMEHCNEFNAAIRDVSVITVRDHAFDKSERSRGKQKRKSGRVSKNFEPSRNPLPVREYHRTCESKILPHVRRGLKLDF